MQTDLLPAAFLVLAAVAAWYVVAVGKAAWSKSPKLPPGPRGVPVLGNLPFLDPNLHHHLTRLSQTYGPIMKLRLGQRLCVVVSSPTVAKELLRDHDATVANHDPPTASLALPNGHHGLVWAPAHGHQWRTLRRLAVGGLLSNAGLEPFRGLRRTHVIGHMAGHVRDRADAGRPVRLRELVYSTLYDVVTGMLWGTTAEGVQAEGGGMELKKVSEEFRQVLESIQGSSGRLNLSDLFPFLAWPLQYLQAAGLHRTEGQKLATRLHRILDYIISQGQKLIDEGREIDQGGDFLQLLLRTCVESRNIPQTTANYMPLTIDHVKGLILDLLVAGLDATTVTTEWAMSELLNNPETMKKAQEELDRVVGTNSPVEETHLSNLPYLNAIVKETLRLRPAAPMMLPRTPTETCTAGGYVVPKGCRILVNLWAMQRDPQAWDEPSEFRPQRFLLNTTSDINMTRRDFTGSDFSFFPFGTGRRICPGALLADRMTMYVLAALLHMFDWRLPDGIAQVDLTEKFGVVMKKAVPLLAVPSRRLPNTALYSSILP